MIKNIILLLICFSYISLHAQTAPGKYWLRFTDKNNNGYSIDFPEEFLSQRALERRQNQGIDIIQNDLPVTQMYIDSLESLGLQVLTVSKWFNAATVATNNVDLIDTISNLGFIVSWEKVLRIKNNFEEPVYKQVAERDGNRNKNLKVLYDYGGAANQIEMLNGHLLHNQGYMGDGIQIAVIDAGFTYVDIHPVFDSIRTNNQILGTKDFVDGDDYVYAHHTHGMNVMSTMAGFSEGNMIGTAPKAKYWLLRSEDTGSEYRIEEDNWIAAAEFADSVGADIINTSLGYNTFNDVSQDYLISDLDGNTSRITIGADLAASKGILVVSSAGNDGNTSWHYINFPADGDSVLAIGAVKSDGSYAALSSTGPSADGRIKPDVAAMGKDACIALNDSAYGTGSGTSFSSPILAGMAACLWQAYPSLSNMEILHAIQESANQYDNPDSLKGYGIPDFNLAHLMLQVPKSDGPTGQPELIVYPNPFDNNIHIEYQSIDSQDVRIELIDILGRQVYERNCTVFNLDHIDLNIENTNKLQPGIYILKVTSNDKVISHTLVKEQE